MRVLVVAFIWLVACKERGTIGVPASQPCIDMSAVEPDRVAIYLTRFDSCDRIACGLADFDCRAPDCIPGCPDGDGYCTMDEVMDGIAVDPPSSGDYTLVLSYRYPGAARDEGIACYELSVDADGTQSTTVTEGALQCCMQP